METIKELEFYNNISNNVRLSQSESVYNALKDHFYFEKIECIETGASQNLSDGCFGIYLAKICETHNGIFKSVDINEHTINDSKIMYNNFLPNFNIEHYISDSIKFLKEYKGCPNLVHLDSRDLYLANPVPSMLHGWLEFDAIKDKMPSKSIVIIDDNFLKGTWVDWIINISDPNNVERIDITYDIIGKGSLIYHWAQNDDTDWDLIGDHYNVGTNIKVIIKKR
jgi:hypothetical protein